MGLDAVMLSPESQLSHQDEVLVALLAKNTELGQELVDATVAQWLALDVARRGDLPHFFVNRGLCSRTEMFHLVKARNFALLRREDKRIARRAVRKGYLSRNKVEEGLDFQKQLFKALGDIKRLHEIFVDDGSLTREQVGEILDEYRQFLHRRGEEHHEARTDPTLLKKQG
jgi:hypothetical protein